MTLVFNEKCCKKDCNETSSVRVHYKPMDGVTEDPAPLCSEHYESVDEKTGRKYWQTNTEKVEVLMS